MQVIVDNLLISYELNGKGKLILLLHGWGDSGRGLRKIQEALSNHYQVLTVDLPGMGASQVPTTTWGLSNYSHFLKDLLIKLDLRQPYVIIGHSNGGAIAIRAISLGDLNPEKLVLLASAGIRNEGNIKKSILKVIAKTGKATTLGLSKKHREKLRKSLYSAVGSDLLALPQLEETFKKTVAQDVQTDAANISLPTLMIYGDQDTATPPEFGRKFNKLIKGSTLKILPNSGHFVHLDRTNDVNKLIEEFVDV